MLVLDLNAFLNTIAWYNFLIGGQGKIRGIPKCIEEKKRKSITNGQHARFSPFARTRCAGSNVFCLILIRHLKLKYIQKISCQGTLEVVQITNSQVLREISYSSSGL